MTDRYPPITLYISYILRKSSQQKVPLDNSFAFYKAIYDIYTGMTKCTNIEVLTV